MKNSINQEITKVRLLSGFVHLKNNPVKIIIPVMIELLLFCGYKGIAAQIAGYSPNQLLALIFGYSLLIVYLALAILLLLWLVSKLGIPRIANRIENSLMAAFTAKDLRGGCPILIAATKIKGAKALRLEFFSKTISKEIWTDRQEAILDAMNMHLLEPISYGGKNCNNRNRIVLIVAKGASTTKRGDIYDDQI